MRTIVCVLNNIGVVYVMRNKLSEALSYFARAVMGRMFDFDSYVALYQAALIETNVPYNAQIKISFACKLSEKYDDAGHYLNKSILGFEMLDKVTT